MPEVTTNEFFRTLVREAQERKARTRLEASLVENMSDSAFAPMTETDWEEIRREIRECVTRRKLEELRREVQNGFEQVERGEYTEYVPARKWPTKSLRKD